MSRRWTPEGGRQLPGWLIVVILLIIVIVVGICAACGALPQMSL